MTEEQLPDDEAIEDEAKEAAETPAEPVEGAEDLPADVPDDDAEESEG